MPTARACNPVIAPNALKWVSLMADRAMENGIRHSREPGCEAPLDVCSYSKGTGGSFGIIQNSILVPDAFDEVGPDIVEATSTEPMCIPVA